ncbi:MAG: Crp/Fnr family transcriptional regulator [Coriobacteriales bacterium]|jgi:CRP/FNR family transcriptional regulator|nr:Crp/Fnr family transcriptional regulator [Coriobacteriales bacterium]
MTQSDFTSYLHSIPLFSDVTDETCAVLAGEIQHTHAKAGQIIVREGDELEHFFILRRGKVACCFVNPDGKKYIIETIGAGIPFAVAAALVGSRYDGIIEVTEDAELLVVPAAPIKKMLQNDAAFAAKLALRSMEDNLHLSDLIKGFTVGAQARLGRYLFRQALQASARLEEGVKFELSMPKTDLAAFLGITPETLSRTFSYLQNKRIITVKGSSIIVHSIRDLVNVSEGL